jgi:murein DD-endopeptidase MepM/ murein hydrolase activator NlpD
VAGGLSLVASPGTTTEAAAPASADLPEYHLVAGETIARESWVLPVESYELTGRFGAVSGLWSTVHTGLDFATVVGAPIRSVANGVVVSVGYDGAYGNKTVIRLGDGTEVWYCHQTSASVVPGQRVERGQVIGTVGVTGNTTGPHLHLEIRPGGGDPVDPELSLRRHRVEP